MKFSDIYGQTDVKRRLIQSVQEGRVPHAQIICGPEGSEKLELALAFAQYVNCTNRTETDSCGVCPSCRKFAALVHPDLHFAYPIVKTGDKNVVCSDFATEWRDMILHHSPFSLNAWLDFIGAENKQGVIYAGESEEIIGALSQKSFEADTKVMIIWLPEKMNPTCANKLLKVIEEPVGKTLFLLVSDNPDAVLGTIQSRTQRVQVPPLTSADVLGYLAAAHPELTEEQRTDVAHVAGGNLLAAEDALSASSDNKEYFDLFVELMRAAYARKTKQLLEWTNKVVPLGRKRHSAFIDYMSRMVRESFIFNMKQPPLNFMTGYEQNFSLRFSPFVNERNVMGLSNELQLAARDVERNVQPKMIFFDFALKVTMLLKL